MPTVNAKLRYRAYYVTKRFAVVSTQVHENVKVRNLKSFVLRIEGQLAISASADNFWYNRLLLELGIDVMQETEEGTVEFHSLLLVGNACRRVDLSWPQ